MKQITPIDFTEIQQVCLIFFFSKIFEKNSFFFKKLNSCIALCQTKQNRTLKEYNRIKKQLIHLTPKLLIGNAYLRARYNEHPIEIQPLTTKKRRKRLKLTIEKQLKKDIGDAYHKLQIQRDQKNISIPIQPPIITENIIEHEFLPPCT